MAKTSGKGSGLTKEFKCSEELRDVVKQKKISRGAMMKALWKYIKKHKLQSKDDKRIIECDDKLSALFKKAIAKKRKFKMRGKTIRVPAGQIYMTEMAGPLGKHLG